MELRLRGLQKIRIAHWLSGKLGVGGLRWQRVQRVQQARAPLLAGLVVRARAPLLAGSVVAALAGSVVAVVALVLGLVVVLVLAVALLLTSAARLLRSWAAHDLFRRHWCQRVFW